MTGKYASKRNTAASRGRSWLLLLASLIMPLILVMAAGFCVYAEDELPDNGIPVVYVKVDETGDNPTIEEMLASPDHSVSCEGTLDIVVPPGFHYADFPDLDCTGMEDLVMSIRGRGNSTWQRSDKKPFKIKLDKKADVFGLGSNKHWVLLANDFDPTLIKDRMTGWLSDEVGFDFSPRGVPVDLVLTGDEYGTKYLGSYYLSEQVRVDTNRLDIAELTEDDTDPDVITGGYLLQESSQHYPSSPDVFYTERGANWATNTPTFDVTDGGYVNEAQQTYIQNHIQKIEDALYAEDHKSSDGTDYRDLMDIESAAKYWLINEVSKNHDAYVTGSTYIYKDRDADGKTGKLYWGPVWDFDFAWQTWESVEDFGRRSVWYDALLYDREENGFVEEVYRQWPAMKAALLEMAADGGLIDKYYEETKASEAKNREIWPPEDNRGSYEEEIDKLKDWIRRRVAWLDENLHLLDNYLHRVKFVDGEEIYDDYLLQDGWVPRIPSKKPVKEGFSFIGWADEEGNVITEETHVHSDLLLTPKFVSDDEVSHAEDIAFKTAGDVKLYHPRANRYTLFYDVIPASAQDREIEWIVSDPEFASVDEDGYVEVGDPGETPRMITITGKLKSGNSRTFTLLVTNGEAPIPVSIRPESEVIEMIVGDQSVCPVVTDPFPASVYNVEYSGYDENVISVDPEFGIITAVGPGTTKIKLSSTSIGEDGWEHPIINETEVTVIVREKEDPEPEPDPEPDPEPADPSGGEDPDKPSGDIDPDGPGKDDMDTDTSDDSIDNGAADGKSDGSPDAGEKADRNSVRTGDNENLYSWVALLTMSSLLLALTAVIRKKHR